jgi:TatA/E family protein of Tat protein translocase
MPTVLLFLEFLGTSELLVIAVVALLLFGPRKLPDIGRTLGKSLAEFKRASDDFKRTWEYEVELERRKPALDAAEEPHSVGGELPEQSANATSATATSVTAEELMNNAVQTRHEGQTVARAPLGAEAARGAGGGAQDAAGGGFKPSAARNQEEIELNAS